MSESTQPRVEGDDVVEAFFSQPPPAPETGADAWEPRPMNASERKAMTATFAMLGFFAVVSMCFAAYADLAMVKPAPLSGAEPRPLSPSLSASTNTEATSVVQRAVVQRAEPAPVVAIATPRALQPDRGVQEPAPQRAAEPLPSPTPPDARESAASRQRAVQGGAPIVEGITKRAYSELKQGHFSDAIYLATQAIRLDPSRASAYIALAGARDAIGDHAGALAAFRDCAQQAKDRLVSACKTMAR